ncbi:helicase-related protein [Actinokineospora xionganensis]|uniref:DEAD/DEAH box helicase family protein n=1 Tax=Actinokineospora xionganensis TaxID=2684470 RepID=A0ABR7LGP7_9PSEU|nr:helicase-related protein [Actinokineospora xionganensis]MBC6451462.1 DEAD/DEAH box helicase family protein [Actinokineospora xionganensis]
MRIIDNLNEFFGDDLKASIKPGSKLRIAASTFSIFAFEALRRELQSIKELEFIFTAPSFTTTKATDKPAQERRQFFIPNDKSQDAALYGTEFEIRLRNKLTQRAIARECAEWVRQKVTFRSNHTGAPMQSFAVVDDTAAYAPLHGFTTADLGFERGPAVSNMVHKIDDKLATRQYMQLFDQIWHNPDQLDDVTEAVREHIASVYAENSPQRVYFLILYNLFNEFLEDISEDVLPNDRTGYQGTEVWKALYNFQKDAATGVINKLETYNGCVLADSVGLGKTFTALAVIKYYELRNKTVLVLAPKKLTENWTNYNSNYTTNIFTKDRFNYDVLAHTDLSRDSGESLGKRLDLINWGNYDLVVIDESHNFRNADIIAQRETRYQRLMRKVIRAGVKTKVLMLSATPVNNRFNDLRNQLALAYEGDSTQLATKLNIQSIEEVFRQAQRVFNEWSALTPEQRTTDAILAQLDFDFFELLDAVTIARSRKHIQAFYDTTDIGAFPERMKPESLRPPLTDLASAPTFNEIFEQLQLLTLAVYTPLAYVFESRRDKYEQIYGAGAGQNYMGGENANLGAANREQGIRKLMTVNLLKRLESSIEAFRLTLNRLEHTIADAVEAVDNHAANIADFASAFTDIDADDDDFEFPTSGTVGRKVQIDLADMDVESWSRDLAHDGAVIQNLLGTVSGVTPERDSKLRALLERLDAKFQQPLNPGNRKVLIFSAFADTAEYLYKNLAPALKRHGYHSALVTGQGNPSTTVGKGYSFQQILTLFSPQSKQRHLVMPQETSEIDLLVGTDCISEGQNLQDCDFLVNYDIHWNPVRIIQRFGRIDRIGSTNERIQLVNFWPDISLDEYINLKERVENRMVAANLGGTGDDNILDPEASDAAFRKEQLRKLQDEVIELEDVRTGVSITDLGLNDFRMDLLGYLKEYGDLAGTPKGLHAVVPAQPEKGLKPGEIFVLRNINADQDLNRGNRLHPYYLVYLDDDGQVIADHTEVKHLLDLIRAGCRNRDEPAWEVCRVFNAATRDGAEMGTYSRLLTDAIRSMIDLTDERDVDSLFSPGHTTALAQTIAGLDDFELTAFLAIVEEPTND